MVAKYGLILVAFATVMMIIASGFSKALKTFGLTDLILVAMAIGGLKYLQPIKNEVVVDCTLSLFDDRMEIFFPSIETLVKSKKVRYSSLITVPHNATSYISYSQSSADITIMGTFNEVRYNEPKRFGEGQYDAFSQITAVKLCCALNPGIDLINMVQNDFKMQLTVVP